MIHQYLTMVTDLIQQIEAEQTQNIEQAAQLIAQATASGHSFFAFGCSHSGLLVQDIYYRAGTFMLVNPLFGPGMSLSNDFPPTKTSAMERLPGLAAIILNSSPVSAGDVLLIVSTSGRNEVPVEMAKLAKARGLSVIVITSIAYSEALPSHDPEGLHVHELADVVIDNKAPAGDASLALAGIPAPVGPVSSVTGTAILHALMCCTAERLLEMGVTPPVYMSGNLEGGPQYNREMLKKYQNAIHY